MGKSNSVAGPPAGFGAHNHAHAFPPAGRQQRRDDNAGFGLFPKCVHHALSRRDAEDILNRWSTELGTRATGAFLLRRATDANRTWILSVFGKRGIVHRRLVSIKHGTKWSIQQDTLSRASGFDNIGELIQFYRQAHHSVPGTGTALKVGCGLEDTDDGATVVDSMYDWDQIPIPPSVSIDVAETGRDPTGVSPSKAITWTFRMFGQESVLSMTPTTLTSTAVVRKWIFFRVTQVRSVYLQRAQYFEARTKTMSSRSAYMLRIATAIFRTRPIVVFAVCAALALVLAIEGGKNENLDYYWVAGWLFALLPLVSFFGCVLNNKYLFGESIRDQIAALSKMCAINWGVLVFMEFVAMVVFVGSYGYRKRCDNQDEPYFHKLKCSKAPYTPPSPVVDEICDDDMCDDEFSAMFRTFVFLQLFILVLAVGIWYKWPGSIKFSSESTTMAKLAWFSFYGPAQHGFPVHITLAGDAELMHEVAEKLYAYMPDTLLQKPVTDMLQVTGSVSAAPVT